MKASVTFSIALHWVNQLVAVFIKGSACSLEITTRLCKIVVINEIISCVIGRVYINHLDLSEIIFSENFQYVKVVTLDIEIFGVPKIFGSIQIRAKCLIGGLIGET